MSDVLIADIGATNSRFALVGADGRPDRIISFADDGVESLEAAIARYLQLIGRKPSAPSPSRLPTSSVWRSFTGRWWPKSAFPAGPRAMPFGS